eukprot:3992945-Lingulodinium_polyedra.AAC.1
MATGVTAAEAAVATAARATAAGAAADGVTTAGAAADGVTAAGGARGHGHRRMPRGDADLRQEERPRQGADGH